MKILGSLMIVVTFSMVAATGCSAPPSPGDDETLTSIDAEALLGPGAVFTLSNAADGNAVIAFSRAPTGELTPAGSTPTGGLGSGGGLGSQGAVALSGNLLVAVNAGSDDISAFRVEGTTLTLLSRVPSGGVRPISAAIYGNRVYVLNAGGTNNVSEFRLERSTHERSWHLGSTPSSSQPLSGASVGPAEVSVSPYGSALVVTEKGTNSIDVYPLGHGGIGAGQTYPSVGQTPFGFAFTGRGRLIVSEAFGGAPGAGAISSYAIGHTLRTISGSVADLQAAPCWVVVSSRDKFAYTSNTASGSISGYSLERNGALTLLNGDGRTGVTGDGTKPADMAFDRGTAHLYVIEGGTHDIAMFDRNADGSLSKGSAGPSVPATAVGLAAQ